MKYQKKQQYYIIFSGAIFAFILMIMLWIMPEIRSENKTDGPGQRLEKLDRGLAAMQTDQGIYLSWRLFFDEDPVFGKADSSIHFTVLRDETPIAELDGMTNYTDTAGSLDSVYRVRSSRGDTSAAVQPFSNGKNYFDIPLVCPEDGSGTYTINDVSTGDLDGDGALDLVIKWDGGGLDNAIPGQTGTTFLDAYRLDGTRLWKTAINLGPNIRSGPHYTQFLVYDLDRDGKSEIICKTAPGSADAAGNYVSKASSSDEIRNVDDRADFRSEEGIILKGDEFLTVFRGETGEAADTIYYPNQRIDTELWGDCYGNRSERYTAAIAWLDGTKPFAVFMRGYYMGKKLKMTASGRLHALSALMAPGCSADTVLTHMMPTNMRIKPDLPLSAQMENIRVLTDIIPAMKNMPVKETITALPRMWMATAGMRF